MDGYFGLHVRMGVDHKKQPQENNVETVETSNIFVRIALTSREIFPQHNFSTSEGVQAMLKGSTKTSMSHASLEPSNGTM